MSSGYFPIAVLFFFHLNSKKEMLSFLGILRLSYGSAPAVSGWLVVAAESQRVVSWQSGLRESKRREHASNSGEGE